MWVVIVVGTSLIVILSCVSGMEVASYLIDKASSVTVIGSSELPYQNTLGPEIGKVTMTVKERKEETEGERERESWIPSPHVYLQFRFKLCCSCRCCRSRMWNSTWTIMWLRSEVSTARSNWNTHFDMNLRNTEGHFCLTVLLSSCRWRRSCLKVEKLLRPTFWSLASVRAALQLLLFLLVLFITL